MHAHWCGGTHVTRARGTPAAALCEALYLLPRALEGVAAAFLPDIDAAGGEGQPVVVI